MVGTVSSHTDLSTAAAAMPVTSLMRGPERRRQVAVVGQCPLDLHEDVASRISKHRSYAAQPPLALEDETSVADDDVTLSAGRPEDFLRHDVERTVVPDRQSDVVALRAGQVHDAFPRATHRFDVRDRNGRDRPDVGATTSETENPTRTVTARICRPVDGYSVSSGLLFGRTVVAS